MPSSNQGNYKRTQHDSFQNPRHSSWQKSQGNATPGNSRQPPDNINLPTSTTPAGQEPTLPTSQEQPTDNQSTTTIPHIETGSSARRQQARPTAVDEQHKSSQADNHRQPPPSPHPEDEATAPNPLAHPPNEQARPPRRPDTFDPKWDRRTSDVPFPEDSFSLTVDDQLFANCSELTGITLDMWSAAHPSVRRHIQSTLNPSQTAPPHRPER